MTKFIKFKLSST